MEHADEYQENEPNFDIVEDLFIYMLNDSMFYRKHYFPVMSDIKDCIADNKDIDIEEKLNPVIDKALQSYSDKYDLPDVVEDYFNDDERRELVDKIYSAEIDDENNTENDELNDIKRLAGIENKFEGYKPVTKDMLKTVSEKRDIERSNNIVPGTNEWFKLWFSYSNPSLNSTPGFRGRR